MVQTRQGDLRGLKALVAVLGVLIVLGTALVIGVVIKRIYASAAPASTVLVTPAPGEPGVAPLKLPAGAKITAVAAAGGLFAVAVSGPAGEQLWLIDPRTGARSLAVSGGP